MPCISIKRKQDQHPLLATHNPANPKTKLKVDRNLKPELKRTPHICHNHHNRWLCKKK